MKHAFSLIDKLDKNLCVKNLTTNSDVIHYLSKIRNKDNSFELLINRSDSEIADPIFSNLKTRTYRTVPKKSDEGQDFSAHLFIKLPKNDAEPALMLLESCSGLSSSVIIKYLNNLLKTAHDLNEDDAVFQQNHPDGSCDSSGKSTTYNVTYQFDIKGHISTELEDDLKRGQLTAFELIDEKNKSTSVDDGMNLQEHCTVLCLKTQDKTKKQVTLSQLSDLWKKHPSYQREVLRFDSGDGKNNRTVQLAIRNAQDTLYVRREKISFDHDLKSSYEELNADILTEMKRLIEEK